MPLSWWTSTIGSVTALFCAYLVQFYRLKATKRYQHPDTLPILGNFLNLAQRRSLLFQWLLEQDRRFGRPYILTSPLVADILIDNEPADLEYVMKNIDGFRKGKPYSETLHDAFGNGMIGVDGEPWKAQRKAGLLMFTQKNLKAFVDKYLPDQMCKTKEFLNAHQHETIDLQTVFFDFTSRVWLQATFGENAAGDTEFMSLFDRLTAGLDSRFRNPFWKITEKIFGSDFADAARELRPRVKALVAESNCELAISLKEHLETEEDVVDAALTFLFAGRDTMAASMSWMFEALMHQPSLVKKVREESTTGTTLDYHELKDLNKTRPIAHGVVSETFRLYPSLPLNMRECHETTVLPSGVPVKAGSNWVLWSPWVMGRSEKIWGPDAELFRPERWIELEGRNKSPFEHTVFHGGPRSCLGQSLVKLIVPYVLLELTGSFDFEKVGAKARSTNSIILRMEGGLPCRALPKSE